MEFHLKVAGVTFEGRQAIVRNLNIGERLYFVPEPTNPYDPHAVNILTEHNQSVGYIPREHNYQIFMNLMNGNGTYEVSVSSITGGGFNQNYGCNILVRYY